jgi:hypothetical protein
MADAIAGVTPQDPHEHAYIDAKRGTMPDDHVAEDIRQYRAINASNAVSDEAPSEPDTTPIEPRTTPPSLSLFLEKSRPLNPKFSDSQLVSEYTKLYGAPARPALKDFLEKSAELNPDYTPEKLTEKYTELYGAEPTEQGNVSRGFEVGMGQLAPTLQGAVGLLGATAERALGEGGAATRIKEWGLQGFTEGMKKLAPLQRDNDQLTDVWTKVTEQGDVGALRDFVAYGIGYGASQLLQSATVGVAGAVAGSAIGGPAGTVPGAVAGVLEQTAGKGLITQWVNAAIAKRVAQGMTQEAAVKSIGRDIGALGAMGTFATGQEMGQIYPAAEAEAKLKGEPITAADLARVWGASAIAGGSELIPEAYIFGKALGRFTSTSPSRLVRAGGAAATGSALESGQEAFQTAVEHAGAGQPIADEAGLKDIINSAGLAAIPGFGGGVIAGTVSPSPPQPPAGKILSDIASAKTTDEAVTAFKQVGDNTPAITNPENLDAFIQNQATEGLATGLHAEWKGQKDADQALLTSVFRDYIPEAGQPTPLAVDARGVTTFNGSPLEALHPQELPDTTPPDGGLSKQKYEVLNTLAGYLGLNVTVFKAGNGLPDGLVHSAKAPTTIFLSSHTRDADLFSVFTHEAVHRMQGTPFYDAIADAVWSLKTPEWKQLAIERHGNLSEQQLRHEMVADIGGTEFHKPEVWQKVFTALQDRVGAEQAKTETLGFIDTLKNLIAQVKELITSHPWTTSDQKTLADQYVTDLTKVHDALA